MSLTLYNTLTNKEEEFKALNEEDKIVTMYTCGPTVYGRPHIGNYSSFLMADLLRRWLEVSGYEVIHAKNITDVGHLAGDATADATGEDKIERQAKAEQVDPLVIALKYTEQYLEDERILNFIEPEYRPKATEVIEGMLSMIRTLLDNGHAYETEDGVYFSVESFKTYGQLSGNTLDQLNAGARIQVDELKKHPADFALWKKCVGDNAHHLLRWSFETGERLSGTQEDASAGFPGWHIECSVMSSQFLGEQFDIHTGGEDLIFPHHECEIAQSECCSGLKSVNYWIHRRFIDMGDQKMSKSLGNVLSIPDIIEMGYSPLDLRYYLLSVHYRTGLKFTEKGIEDARKARRKIVEWIEEVSSYELLVSGSESKTSNQQPVTSNKITEYIQKFTEAMNSDLNTPAALATVFDTIAWARKQESFTEDAALTLSDFIEMITHTFGCFENDFDDGQVPEEIVSLLDERKTARDTKDYKKSDELRDQIASLGYEVKDGPDGQTVKKL